MRLMALYKCCMPLPFVASSVLMDDDMMMCDLLGYCICKAVVLCAQVMMRRGEDYITNHLPSVHRDMTGVSPPDARVQYIRDLSEPPVAHNMHFYRLRRRKYDPVPGNDWLAICPKGLEVYEVTCLMFT